MSPVSSESSHTPLCQLPGSHASLINDLILRVDIPWNWEFTLCCNSVTHRMTFWFWLSRYLSSAAMVDKGLFQGRQKLSGHLYRLGIAILRSYSPPPCFPVVWEQLVNFIILIISTKVVKETMCMAIQNFVFCKHLIVNIMVVSCLPPLSHHIMDYKYPLYCWKWSLSASKCHQVRKTIPES